MEASCENFEDAFEMDEETLSSMLNAEPKGCDADASEVIRPDLPPDVSKEFRERAQKVLEVVKTLPQSNVIDPSECVEWIKNVVALSLKQKGQDPVWHARRLRGIGSSEIGACVTTYRGEYTPFQSARDTSLFKLMKRAPDGGTEDTERGHIMEPIIQRMFLEQFKTRSEREMMRDMADFQVQGSPWMVGNPDEICYINGKLYVVDYKAPSVAVLADLRRKGEIKFDYVCQLHHLEHIAKAGGLPIAGRLLCSFDYQRGKLDVRVVEFNPALLDEMIEVGNDLWFNHILRGEPIPYTPAPRFEDLVAEDFVRLNRLGTEYTIMRTVGKAAYDRSEEILADIQHISGKYELQDAVIKLDYGSVKAKQMLDTDQLRAIATGNGREMPEDDDDEGLLELMAFLDEKGVSRDKYLVEEHKFSISRTKAKVDQLDLFKETGTRLIGQYVETHLNEKKQQRDVAIAEEQAKVDARAGSDEKKTKKDEKEKRAKISSVV